MVMFISPENCPDPSVHGNPFRYCPYCTWIDTEPNPKWPCPTPDCPGDGRYMPPGRGHRSDCTATYGGLISESTGLIEQIMDALYTMPVEREEAKAAALAVANWLEENPYRLGPAAKAIRREVGDEA